MPKVCVFENHDWRVLTVTKRGPRPLVRFQLCRPRAANGVAAEFDTPEEAIYHATFSTVVGGGSYQGHIRRQAAEAWELYSSGLQQAREDGLI